MNVFMVTPPLVKTSLLDRNAQKERYKTRRGITRVGNAGMTGCYKSVVGGREETLRRLADPSNQIRQTKQPHRVRGASSLYPIPIGLGSHSATVRFVGRLRQAARMCGVSFEGVIKEVNHESL